MVKRESNLEILFGKTNVNKIKKAPILVIGAGGIGCELLKDLVMSGFHNILDLDTIDLSNLNRQFLFQKQHIKQSKAMVARESALKFNPNAKVIAHHGSIFEDQYDLVWFKKFKLVLNALDNVAARRHVNKMCLAANIPLVESGTAGYHGQDKSKCYDCDPKELEQKTYPVCTIRSTPSAPIHCIVWAKNYLFNALFGRLEEEDLDASATAQNAKEIENMKRENDQLKKMRESIGSGKTDSIFETVFIKDVETLRSMEDLWKTRTKPKPLSYETIKKELAGLKPMDSASLDFDQIPWTFIQNVKIFNESLTQIGKDLTEERLQDADIWYSFDKDDERFLNFVTAAANIRAHIFHIETKSRFMVKEMAGNIIPAIATTNAIVAGMIVVLALKVLLGQLDECQYTFVAYGGDRNHLLMNEDLAPPNPQCVVCSNGYFLVHVNTSKTLKELIEAIKADLNIQGEITVQMGEQLLYDVEFEDNIDSTLESLNIRRGSQLTVTNDHEVDETLNHSVVLFVSPWRKKAIDFSGDRKLKPRPIPPKPVEEEAETKPAKKLKEDVILIEGDELAPISLDD